MKKRIFFITLIIVSLIYPNLSMGKDDYRQKYKDATNHYYELVAKARSSGYDITEAEELKEQAKLAEQEGFFRAALVIIEQANKKLEEKLEGEPDLPIFSSPSPTSAATTPTPTRTMEPTKTPTPTETMEPTKTPTPTETMEPTKTPAPTKSVETTAEPTKTAEPIKTATPTRTPQATENPLQINSTKTAKPTQTPTQANTPQEMETLLPENFDKNEESPFGLDACHQALFNELLPYYKASGAKWLLFDSLIWEKKTPPNWPAIDKEITFLYQNGFSIVMEVHLASPEFPSDIEDYAKFIFRCAARYDGDGDYNNDGITDGPPLPKINYWKIIHEPALERFWKDTPENYGKLMKVSAENIHKANPDGKVLFGGISNKGDIMSEKSNKDFLEKFLSSSFSDGTKAADYMDIMTYHYYGTSEGMTDFLNSQMNIMKKYNVKKPFMITEFGYCGGIKFSFEDGSFSEASLPKQAIEVVKAHIIALSLGAEKIFYFSLSDQKKQLKDSSNDTIFVSTKSVENIYNHDMLAYNGLFYFDFDPKPALESYKVLSEKLRNKKFSHELLGLGEGIRCFVFVKNSSSQNEPLYVIWNDKEKAQNTSLKLGWKKAKMTSFILLKGEEIYSSELEAKDGSFQIHLGEEPVLLEYSP